MTTVDDLRFESAKEQKEQVRIFNPEIDDFTVKFQGKKYTIHAMELGKYPKRIADHIIKHLANRILNNRGIKVNTEVDLEEIKKEIIV